LAGDSNKNSFQARQVALAALKDAVEELRPRRSIIELYIHHFGWSGSDSRIERAAAVYEEEARKLLDKLDERLARYALLLAGLASLLGAGSVNGFGA
jgi:hypothetical protein